MKTRHVRLFVLCCALAITATACRDYAVLRLRSEPSGAVVYDIKNTRFVGVTPVTNLVIGTIPDSAWTQPQWDPGATFSVEKDGYEPATVRPTLDLRNRKSRSLHVPNYWDVLVELKAVPPPVQAAPPAPAAPIVQEVKAQPVEPTPPPQPVSSPVPAAPTPPSPPPPAPSPAATNTVVERFEIRSGSGGKVTVVSEPPECSVYLDDRFIGNAPVTTTVIEGIRVVEVKKQGYRAYKKVVRIIEDSELTLRARLDRE